MFEGYGGAREGTVYLNTAPDWDRVFDHMDSLVKCRSCRGSGDWKYYREVRIPVWPGGPVMVDFVQDYLLCDRCRQLKDDGKLILMPRENERTCSR